MYPKRFARNSNGPNESQEHEFLFWFFFIIILQLFALSTLLQTVKARFIECSTWCPIAGIDAIRIDFTLLRKKQFWKFSVLIQTGWISSVKCYSISEYLMRCFGFSSGFLRYQIQEKSQNDKYCCFSAGKLQKKEEKKNKNWMCFVWWWIWDSHKQFQSHFVYLTVKIHQADVCFRWKLKSSHRHFVHRFSDFQSCNRIFRLLIFGMVLRFQRKKRFFSEAMPCLELSLAFIVNTALKSTALLYLLVTDRLGCAYNDKTCIYLSNTLSEMKQQCRKSNIM